MNSAESRRHLLKDICIYAMRWLARLVILGLGLWVGLNVHIPGLIFGGLFLVIAMIFGKAIPVIFVLLLVVASALTIALSILLIKIGSNLKWRISWYFFTAGFCASELINLWNLWYGVTRSLMA